MEIEEDLGHKLRKMVDAQLSETKPSLDKTVKDVYKQLVTSYEKAFPDGVKPGDEKKDVHESYIVAKNALLKMTEDEEEHQYKNSKAIGLELEKILRLDGHVFLRTHHDLIVKIFSNKLLPEYNSHYCSDYKLAGLEVGFQFGRDYLSMGVDLGALDGEDPDELQYSTFFNIFNELFELYPNVFAVYLSDRSSSVGLERTGEEWVVTKGDDRSVEVSFRKAFKDREKLLPCFVPNE